MNRRIQFVYACSVRRLRCRMRATARTSSRSLGFEEICGAEFGRPAGGMRGIIRRIADLGHTVWSNTDVMLLARLKPHPFWFPVALFLGLTPFLLVLGLASWAGGEGNYFFTKLFFPFTMLSTIPFHSISWAFIVLGVVQYPLYGLLIGVANLKRKLLIWGLALAIVHSLSVIACLVLVNKPFA